MPNASNKRRSVQCATLIAPYASCSAHEPRPAERRMGAAQRNPSTPTPAKRPITGAAQWVAACIRSRMMGYGLTAFTHPTAGSSQNGRSTMEYLLLIFFVVFGIISVAYRSRRKAPNEQPRDKNRVQIRKPQFAIITQSPIYTYSASYDPSVFVSDKGDFCFPKYNVRAGWVRITDDTPFKDVWVGFDPEEKKRYTVKEFENQFSSDTLALDIADFWDALRAAKKSDLGDFAHLAGHAEALQAIWQRQFQDTEEGIEYSDPPEPFDLAPSLGAVLVQLGVATRLDLSAEENLSRWFHLRTLSALKDICRERGLAISGAKTELIRRICGSPNTTDLYQDAFYCNVNARFVALLDDLAEKYVEKIKTQIERWHPLYIQAVWDEALRVNNGVAPCAVLTRIKAHSGEREPA